MGLPGLTGPTAGPTRSKSIWNTPRADPFKEHTLHFGQGHACCSIKWYKAINGLSEISGSSKLYRASKPFNRTSNVLLSGEHHKRNCHRVTMRLNRLEERILFSYRIFLSK